MKNLKVKISEVLISELEKKTLDKITISDITETLGVSRQAFYYHFFDIYEVVEWIFKEAATKVLNEYGNLDSWKVAAERLMSWCEENKNFVLNSFKSVNREYIETFLYSVINPYIRKVVDEESQNYNIVDSQKLFISEFYTFAFDSLIIDWIKHDMSVDKNLIIENAATLTEGDINKSILNFHEKNNLENEK